MVVCYFSTRSLLFGLAAIVAVVSAVPTSRLSNRAANGNLTSLHITLTNGSATLPSPVGALKAVTVGVGFQNYTCNSSSSSAPVSIGAVATLIDAADGIIPFLPLNNSLRILDTLPDLLFLLGREVIDASSLPKAGVHFFNNQGAPVFDLTESGVGFFVGAKAGDIKAPANAAQGPNGAVDWLSLNAESGSCEIQTVYRIFTASGDPPKTCEGQPSVITQPYSAQYWFFG